MNYDITKLLEYDDHELVVFADDQKTGLRSFIAIHSTNLGPATGGTRYWRYDSEEEALRDALKLSRAMTYKCALAGVPYGGGKGVIMNHPTKPKSKEMLRAYAEKVNLLKGSFSTGEDIGIEIKDIKILLRYSKYINGKPNVAGDLGPWTALGIFSAIKAALNGVFGNAEIVGRTFAIKGLGKVGLEVCDLIYASGGRVIGADINSEQIKTAKKRFPKIRIAGPLEIHRKRVDVFSPCALDSDLNSKSIAELRCQIVCGGANNQLASQEDGERLRKRGILYIPDYLANSGGLINAVAELDKRGYSRRRVEQKVRAIGQTAKKIIELSLRKNKPTNEIADRMAEQIFNRKKKTK